MSSHSATSTDQDRKRRRRPVVAFSLAAIAVLGIGAAATSAAWTDNVFFSASATAATFNLQGSVNGTTWTENDTAGTALTVDLTSQFTNLIPGVTRTTTFQVKNAGSVPAVIATPTVTKTGVAAATGLTWTLTGDTTGNLAPAAVRTYTLTVVVDSAWAESNKGTTGTVVVQVNGASS